LLAGCSRTSVDEGKRLADLDSAERTTICHYKAEHELVGTFTITCNGAPENVVSLTEADCANDAVVPTCGATVGDFLDCADAIGMDQCAAIDHQPAACSRLDGCYSGW
jgi:hypothetical protein